MESSGSNFLTVRVQYLDDTDPFSSISYPEPTRPPNYTLNLDLPLCEQISGVHRLLKAPHKVCYNYQYILSALLCFIMHLSSV